MACCMALCIPFFCLFVVMVLWCGLLGLKLYALVVHLFVRCAGGSICVSDLDGLLFVAFVSIG